MKRKRAKLGFGVIGLGRFGAALARTLAEAGQDVLVIDNNPAKIKEIREYTDDAYIIDELTRESLEETGIQNCDTVIVCIGEKIDVSILTTLHVVNMGVKNVIAKAVSKEQGEVLEKLGAKVVYPEDDRAVMLANNLVFSNIMNLISLSRDIKIYELKIPASLVGKSVTDSLIRKKYELNIIAISNDKEVVTHIDPNYIFNDDDNIAVIGSAENIERFELDEQA